MARLLAFAFFGIFLMAAMAMGSGAILGAANKDSDTLDASQPASPKPAIDSGTDGDAVIIDRDSGGQFTLTARINGQNTNFLVDTGADAVALTVDEAERLGLSVDPENFGPMGQSASGIAYGTIIEVEELTVAGKEFRNIDVVVLAGLQTNLLGQAALRQMGKVELHGDRMTIGGS
jgi:aspartyl protease family protein